MDDKLTLTRAFNNMFIQFLEEVIQIVPEGNDIRKAKGYFEMVKSMNPSAIIKVWFTNVYTPYESVIESGDIISFMVDKEYDSDIASFENTKEIMDVVNRLRHSLRTMGERNKNISMDYVKKLSKLSKLYSRC